MIQFKLLGIPVRVEPWFWLTMVLIGGGLHANDALSILLVGVFVVAGFVSILIHELGHALTIRRYGLPTEIALIAFGGFASYPANRLDRKQSFLVTVAGPGIQAMLGLLALAAFLLLPMPPASLLRAFFYDLAVISLFWALFNCLPVYPMDGGQMLAAVLGPRKLPWVFLTGALVAAAVGLAGYLTIGSLLLAVFMGFFAVKNWQDFVKSRG